jgi:hypothetical protein
MQQPILFLLTSFNCERCGKCAFKNWRRREAEINVQQEWKNYLLMRHSLIMVDARNVISFAFPVFDLHSSTIHHIKEYSYS